MIGAAIFLQNIRIQFQTSGPPASTHEDAYWRETIQVSQSAFPVILFMKYVTLLLRYDIGLYQILFLLPRNIQKPDICYNPRNRKTI